MINNIKNIIREEIDDLDWIRETRINPLIVDNYVVIWFDREPTKSEINTIKGWYTAIGGDNISTYAYRENYYLRFENHEDSYVDYGFGEDVETFYEYVDNTDKYTHYLLSQLFPKNINESEEDDLDWIRDITPYGYEPQIGDFISVVNIGNKHPFLQWLGSHLDNYASGKYGQNITGSIIERPRGFGDNPYNFFFLQEVNTNRVITFPKSHHLEEMRKNVRYRGLNLSYVPVPRNTINESEEDDLDWIRDARLGVPQSGEELKQFVGWSFFYDVEWQKKLGDWYGNGRKWLIRSMSHQRVYYRDTVTGENNDASFTHFLDRLNAGAWVLVSPDGVLLDPHGRVYPKR